jgi:hypothetical protein
MLASAEEIVNRVYEFEQSMVWLILRSDKGN